MDSDAEKTQAELAEKAVKAYLDHPITTSARKSLDEAEEAFVDLICNVDIDSIGAFFAHFAAVGHLRGLRQAKRTIAVAAEEHKEQQSTIKS